MKKLTSEFFEKVIGEALFEYTKKRFLSDDEAEDFTKCFLTAMDGRVEKESFEDAKIAVLFNDI